MPDNPTSSAEDRSQTELTARFSRYLGLRPEEKIRLAMDILFNVSRTWDHKNLTFYPEDMPSFDEFLADIGEKLYEIQWVHVPDASVSQSTGSLALHLLGALPFRSEQISHPEFNYDVSVWQSEKSICERQDEATCDTIAGLYYGSAEEGVTRFCPRHFYEMHFGADAPYRVMAEAAPRRERG